MKTMDLVKVGCLFVSALFFAALMIGLTGVSPAPPDACANERAKLEREGPPPGEPPQNWEVVCYYDIQPNGKIKCSHCQWEHVWF